MYPLPVQLAFPAFPDRLFRICASREVYSHVG